MAVGLKVFTGLILAVFLVSLIASVPAEAKKWYEYVPGLEKLGKSLGLIKDKPAPPPQPPSCTDSDGEDYYSKGYLTYTTSLGLTKEYDSCKDSKVLVEKVCNSQTNGSENFKEYECPYWCIDGACVIPEPIVSVIPDQELTEGIALTIDLKQFFSVPNQFTLSFTTTYPADINAKIENGVVTLTPKKFTGERTIRFSATPQAGSASGRTIQSNTVKLTVKSNTQPITNNLSQHSIPAPTQQSVQQQTPLTNQQTPIPNSPLPTAQPSAAPLPSPTPSTAPQQPVQSTPIVTNSPQATRTCSGSDFTFSWSACNNGWQNGIYTKKAGVNCVGGEPGPAKQVCISGGGSASGVSGGPSGGPFAGGPLSTITTFAGGGTILGAIGDNGPATQARLSAPYQVRTDSTGNLYIADRGNVRIRKVDKATGIITTFPTASSYFHASDLALDSSGNIYIADDHTNSVKKIDKSTGVVTLIAGTGSSDIYYGKGSSGDGGPATAAKLSSPRAIALDSANNIYVSDFENGRIRKISKATGIINTVVGGSEFCQNPTDPCGDGSLATLAKIMAPNSIAFDSQDNMYITGSNRIRKIDKFTGIITTVAGTGTVGSSGDGGPATSAKLNFTSGVDLDSNGNIYIAESWGRRVRKVDISTGIISTIAGTGEEGYSGDGALAINAKLQPFGIHISQDGKLYITDARYQVVRQIG